MCICLSSFPSLPSLMEAAWTSQNYHLFYKPCFFVLIKQKFHIMPQYGAILDFLSFASTWRNIDGKIFMVGGQLTNHIEHITCSSDPVVNALFWPVMDFRIWSDSSCNYSPVETSQQQLQSGKFTTAKKSLRKSFSIVFYSLIRS